MGPACPEQESVSTVKAQTFKFSHGKLIAISTERALTLVEVESSGKELTRSSYTVFPRMRQGHSTFPCHLRCAVMMMVVSQNCSWRETGSFFFHSVFTGHSGADRGVSPVRCGNRRPAVRLRWRGQFYMLPASIHATVQPSASGPQRVRLRRLCPVAESPVEEQTYEIPHGNTSGIFPERAGSEEQVTVGI